MTLQLTLQLDLGRKFTEDLKKAMADEFEVAQDKWKVTLTDEQKEEIRRNALAQLKIRVSTFSGNPWGLSKNITYRVAGASGEYSLPKEKDLLPPLRVIRVSDAWIIEEDTETDSEALADFPRVIKDEIISWARTGVFYGVGSYKN